MKYVGTNKLPCKWIGVLGWCMHVYMHVRIQTYMHTHQEEEVALLFRPLQDLPVVVQVHGNVPQQRGVFM